MTFSATVRLSTADPVLFQQVLDEIQRYAELVTAAAPDLRIRVVEHRVDAVPGVPGVVRVGGVEFQPEEFAVARAVGRGRTNKEIARELAVTPVIAGTLVVRLLRRLGLRNRTAVAVWAQQHGIAEAPEVAIPARREAGMRLGGFFFTASQLRVLDGLRRRRSPAEIAAENYWAPTTVSRYITSIVRRLGVHDRAHAGRFAAHHADRLQLLLARTAGTGRPRERKDKYILPCETPPRQSTQPMRVRS